MNRAWQSFADELAQWRDAGREVEFWWRDDDAARACPALTRLLALAEQAQTPLALAVIPDRAEAGIFASMGPMASVMQHGADHVNRADVGEKKSEFPGSELPASAIARLDRAYRRLERMAGARMVAALAPPWNRIDQALLPLLSGAAICGLSRYGARKSAAPAAGLREVNTHVDIIDWRGSRGFAGEDQALHLAKVHLCARRERRADSAEPTGWLTHHACHDEAAWDFLERLFEFARRSAMVRWRSAANLFG